MKKLYLILLLIFLSPLAWADKVLLSKEYQYKGYSLHFDTNNNGQPDLEEYYSLSDVLLGKEFDNNEDGKPEKSIDYFKIRNVIIYTLDTNNDESTDEIIFELGDRAYHVIDQNNDNSYDEFRIYSDPKGRNTLIYSEDIAFPKDNDGTIYFVIDFLKYAEEKAHQNMDAALRRFYKKELEHWNVVTLAKYRELETLFQEAKRTKKWELLLDKTREYLSYPSNTFIPITIELKTHEEMGGALGRTGYASILQFCPEDFPTLQDWLATADHELMHFVQGYRAFLMLKINAAMTWNEFHELKKKILLTDTMEQAEEILESLSDDKKQAFLGLNYILTDQNYILLCEMEAYFSTAWRFETYFMEFDEEELDQFSGIQYVEALAHLTLWSNMNGKCAEFFRHSLHDIVELLQSMKRNSPEEFEDLTRVVNQEAERLKQLYHIKTPSEAQPK